MFNVFSCSVKLFYRSVKVPDQAGDDVRGEIPDQVGDDVGVIAGLTGVDVGVIAGLTGNLLVFQ